MNKQEIKDLVEETLAKAEDLYERKFDRPLEINFKLSGKCAGICSINYAKWDYKLKFNLAMAEHPDNADKYYLTVIHEVAHWVTDTLHGKKSNHGKEWKMICQELGGDGITYHDMTTPPKVKKKVIKKDPPFGRRLKDGTYFIPFIQTREEARSDGNKLYWTGDVCERNHKSPRYVGTGWCKECYREYRMGLLEAHELKLKEKVAELEKVEDMKKAA